MMRHRYNEFPNFSKNELLLIWLIFILFQPQLSGKSFYDRTGWPTSLRYFIPMGDLQCDQMTRFFQYLAIYSNENLPNSIKLLPK